MTKSDVLDLVARTGQALASGKRLEILELLAQRERGVSELAQTANLNLTTVSAHLQVLREAGLVASRRRGTHIHYGLAGDDVALLLSTLTDVAESHRADVRGARAEHVPEDVRAVTREELAQLVESEDVLVLDVRPPQEFDAGHRPHAVNIPLGELAERLDEIPRDVEVVAYCRGRYCLFAHQAARLLTDAGWSARVLDEGVVEWRAERAAL